MEAHEALDILFRGMDKLGPGSDAHTLQILRSLRHRQSSTDGTFRLVVDAGCGAGRQTLVLARELGAVIHAVDSHQPFLDRMMARAARDGLEPLVAAHCMDMRDIPAYFREIDLLWSEGAAYNIGFTNALAAWQPAVRPDGFVVVSELTWLRANAPEEVRSFFSACYPDMQSIDQNVQSAESAGFEAVETHTLPASAWVEGYYDTLAPRASMLMDHDDATVQALAAEILDEIRIFEHSENSYGYVFYVLRRP